MSKQDPRIIKTLRQIDAALLENLKEKEFQKITIDMLCQSALINRSTFYKYYKDKYDLLDNYIDRVLGDFRNALESTDFILATPYTINNQKYLDNFRKSIEFIYSNRSIYRVLWNASIERNIYKEMVVIIRQNILTKLRENTPVPPDVALYQDLYAELFASNLMTLVYWWFKNENTVTSEDVRRLMNSNMKNGLFTTFKYCI